MTRKEEIEKVAKDIAKANRLAYPEVAVEQGVVFGATWADKNPIHYDGKAMLYVLHKGTKQGKQEMLEEVCKYIKEKLYHAWVNTSNGNTYRTQSTELFIKNLRKAMEEQIEQEGKA